MILVTLILLIVWVICQIITYGAGIYRIMYRIIISALSHAHFCTTGPIHLLRQCYHNDSIQERVIALSKLPEEFSQISMLQDLEIKMPKGIVMTNAKQLLEFHKKNGTKVNKSILHSLAFIEFNAFLAYMDTLVRFGFAGEGAALRDGMPEQELREFRSEVKYVALDQGKHCLLLVQRLKALGHTFGQYPVIANLAKTVSVTASSILERLALISIVHEGRGIKSIDRLIHKVTGCGDVDTVSILKVIQAEEVGHFNVGVKWFRYFCERKYGNRKLRDKDWEVSYEEYVQQVLKDISDKYKTKIVPSDLNFKPNLTSKLKT